jgi:hypothetical protein
MAKQHQRRSADDEQQPTPTRKARVARRRRATRSLDVRAHDVREHDVREHDKTNTTRARVTAWVEQDGALPGCRATSSSSSLSRGFRRS